MSWTDWLGQHPATGLTHLSAPPATTAAAVPASAQAIAAFVLSHPKVRAVASRHADNAIGRPDDGSATIDVQNVCFVEVVKPLPPGATTGTAVVSVGAGTTVKVVNARLRALGLALRNLGSFDGQQLAGAVGTGTHGSGHALGPMADAVLAVDLVDGTGTCRRIEHPQHPAPTDPVAFAHSHPGWVLTQGAAADPWFWAVGVNVGAMGVVVGLQLAVREAFQLSEVRTLHAWSSVKGGLAALATSAAHVEVLVNPYAVGGRHRALVTVRREVASGPNLPPPRRHPSHALADAVTGMLGKVKVLDEVLLALPGIVPAGLDTALGALATKDPKKPYVDWSDEVLLQGLGVEAHGFELAVPRDRAAALVDDLLAIARMWNRPKKPRNRSMLTSPVSLRFAKASPHWLAPCHEAVPNGACPDWCFVEVPRLLATDEARAVRRYPHYPDAVVAALWATWKTQGVRPHWGQSEHLDPAAVPAMYPRHAAWATVAAALDPSRRFVTARTARIGLR
jgi:FAD/FMN-containing dehydrogenase